MLTGLCGRKQKEVSKAIKKARSMGKECFDFFFNEIRMCFQYSIRGCTVKPGYLTNKGLCDVHRFYVSDSEGSTVY